MGLEAILTRPRWSAKVGRFCRSPTERCLGRVVVTGFDGIWRESGILGGSVVPETLADADFGSG